MALRKQFHLGLLLCCSVMTSGYIKPRAASARATASRLRLKIEGLTEQNSQLERGRRPVPRFAFFSSVAYSNDVDRSHRTRKITSRRCRRRTRVGRPRTLRSEIGTGGRDKEGSLRRLKRIEDAHAARFSKDNSSELCLPSQSRAFDFGTGDSSSKRRGRRVLTRQRLTRSSSRAGTSLLKMTTARITGGCARNTRKSSVSSAKTVSRQTTPARVWRLPSRYK